ncbi:hypothetical protein [Arabiibacter massiliensis]|uniref:hypothetical protein n=1 Tax=Arabiibacter massiliensis TaxID=1870985 RepID=UPI00117A101F|nr:hypothetical protein [Arabiibacter massiliensis]
MVIRIGEDGTIISSDGETLQGQNSIIGDDGSIRLDVPASVPEYPVASVARTPPSSPLENIGTIPGAGQHSAADSTQSEEAGTVSSSQVSRSTPRISSRPTRTRASIEYELQVKKAELRKCIRPIPIVVCVLFAGIALALGNVVPAVVSLGSLIPIVKDILRRREVSDAISKLDEELGKADGRGA